MTVAVAILILIAEPKLANKLPQFKQPLLVGVDSNTQSIIPLLNESLFRKIKRLSKIVYKDSTSNIVFPVAFYANFIQKVSQMLMSTFLTLWVQNFIALGILEDSS